MCVAHVPRFFDYKTCLSDSSNVVSHRLAEHSQVLDDGRPLLCVCVCVQFRMSNCGLPCPVYLVEKFGDASHFSIPEKSLKQAIANTQVGGHVGVANTGGCGCGQHTGGCACGCGQHTGGQHTGGCAGGCGRGCRAERTGDWL